jgi:hypothetical protein
MLIIIPIVQVFFGQNLDHGGVSGFALREGDAVDVLSKNAFKASASA